MCFKENHLPHRPKCALLKLPRNLSQKEDPFEFFMDGCEVLGLQSLLGDFEQAPSQALLASGFSLTE